MRPLPITARTAARNSSRTRRWIVSRLTLASELWIQTEKVAPLSAILERGGLSSPAVEAEVATRDEAAREAALHAFVHRVLAPLREPAD